MARTEDRKKAIELRLEGKTFTEIKAKLDISKSTLSGWLKGYPLSPEHVKNIYSNRSLWIENYRNTMAKKRALKDKNSYDEQKKFWLPLTHREFLLAGLFLYLGEGTKHGSGYVCISNSNPKVIEFAKLWFTNSLKVPVSKIRVLIHLYSDMQVERELIYWGNILNLPRENFRNPYIKNSTRRGLSYKSYGHGTCNLIISDSKLKRKIMQSINAISDYYSHIDII